MAGANQQNEDELAPNQQEGTGSAGSKGANASAQQLPKPLNEPSNAEKKKLAKAEKQAKRAKAKEPHAVVTNGSPGPGNPQRGSGSHNSEPRMSSQSGGLHARSGSMTSALPNTKLLPLRRRPSQTTPNEFKQTDKKVDFVSHLYGQPRRRALEGTPKEVHPMIFTLALQQSNYVIRGSQARCIAMLLALKPLISSYTTPKGNSLPRHLASNHLSPQLSYLKSSRPFSTSQANSIRWLKTLIANLDPSMPEDKAKAFICSSIDTFIWERFTVADQVISDAASQRIKDGDVLLTFGKSVVVQATLLDAVKRGITFRVVVVDARPLMEGKDMAKSLSSEIDIRYCLLSGLHHALPDVTKCILGAHAIFANGNLQSRVGTALVAMAAKSRRIPVMVCAESIKLTDRVALNSLVMNEIAPEEELVKGRGDENTGPHTDIFEPGELKMPHAKTKDSSTNKQSASTSEQQEAPIRPGRGNSLIQWQNKAHLQVLNVLYDVTPSENIDLIITELGSFPPRSAPVVHGISFGS